ncbi:MAG TPA: glucose 1-dehydrogenase [Alphaproteobacteria bacterium]|nr:glucose 1-dehydrogenase [Alphaproteobacteria bacterium]
MARLQDKVAIVTGAAQGIGQATAALLIEEGAHVVLTDAAVRAGEEAAARLGPRAAFKALDVTDAAQWERVIGETEAEFDGLDILVNNAGIVLLKDIETTSLDEWRHIHAVNLDGPFLGCKHAIPAMKRRGGGSIINVSSIAGMIGHHSLAAYCSSKGGLRLLTKSVALHCARRGYNIRCNSVHPSFVATAMVESMIETARDPEKMREAVTRAAPLGRLGEPIDVARTILFLASDESVFTTGAEFVVDGGATAA